MEKIHRLRIRIMRYFKISGLSMSKIKGISMHIPPPFSARDVSELLLRDAASITRHSLSDSVSSADAGIKSRLLVMMLAKVPKVSGLDLSALLSSIHNKLAAPSQLPFLAFASITSLATNLYSTSYISASDLSGLVDPLVRQAWSYLSASYHQVPC